MDPHDEEFLHEFFLALADEPLEANDDRWVVLRYGAAGGRYGVLELVRGAVARMAERVLDQLTPSATDK